MPAGCTCCRASSTAFPRTGLDAQGRPSRPARGAVLGGVTTIFEMPNTHPLTLTAQDLQAKLDLARGRAWCDYAFYIGGSAANAARLPILEKPAGLRGEGLHGQFVR